MASTPARFESSRFLPVGTPEIPVYAAPVDIALWMPVRLSATTPASLSGCGGP
jgi:hypothetical protein